MFAREAKPGDVAIAPLVYLVDDDEDFREEMVAGLTRLGLNVQGFGSAAALYRAYAGMPCEIVVLDIGLQDEDGLSIATHMRASQPVGIIMATARGSINDRVTGLEKGADAYLVKPIDVRELAATVVALHNRVAKNRKLPVPPKSPQWALVEGGWTLVDGLGHHLRLTVSEQRLMGCLFRARGNTVERSALVEAMGADVYDFNYTHLDTIVSRLRRRAKKLNMVLPLHAIRGQGFTFAE
ncbi:protein petR [Labrys sp. WJW]|nr:protein petR [Labrys sp. WJW]